MSGASVWKVVFVDLNDQLLTVEVLIQMSPPIKKTLCDHSAQIKAPAPTISNPLLSEHPVHLFAHQ